MNETTNRQWRVRASARDTGAFENTTTNNPLGPYHPVPLPQLSIAPSSGNLVLSWPSFVQNFQLQQSDLSDPLSWSQWTNGYVTNATGIGATVQAGAGGSLFRLRK